MNLSRPESPGCGFHYSGARCGSITAWAAEELHSARRGGEWSDHLAVCL